MKKIDDWKEDIKRVSNLIVEKEQNTKIICITGLSENAIQKDVAEILSKGLEERNKKVFLIDVVSYEDTTGASVDKVEKEIHRLKSEYEYIIINDLCISKFAVAVAIAGLSDETILLVEKDTINGNKAIELKRELDMNGAHVLGSIFIK